VTDRCLKQTVAGPHATPQLALYDRLTNIILITEHIPAVFEYFKFKIFLGIDFEAQTLMSIKK
jgi:hypothetical protein